MPRSFKWRAKFGSMDVPVATPLRELEGENANPNKLLDEAHRDMPALKSVLGVKRWPPALSGASAVPSVGR